MRFWRFLAKNWTSTLTERGEGGQSLEIEIFAKIKYQDCSSYYNYKLQKKKYENLLEVQYNIFYDSS